MDDQIIVIIGIIGIVWWFGSMFIGALREMEKDGSLESNRRIREQQRQRDRAQRDREGM